MDWAQAVCHWFLEAGILEEKEQKRWLCSVGTSRHRVFRNHLAVRFLGAVLGSDAASSFSFTTV